MKSELKSSVNRTVARLRAGFTVLIETGVSELFR